MVDKPVVVDSETTVRETAIAMDRANLGSILVTSNRRVVGIVTERDLVRKILATTKDSATKVKHVMSTPMVVVNPEATIEEAAEIMSNNKIRRLAVADKQRLVGIITVVDIAKAWASTTKRYDPVLDALTRIPGPHSRLLSSAWRSSVSTTSGPQHNRLRRRRYLRCPDS